MPEDLRVPSFSYNKLGEKANKLLVDLQLVNKIPVDVEKVIDNIYRMHIIIFPGLYRNFKINAYTAIDYRKIYVDQYLYERLERQYRFTLAHELGHIYLHDTIYKKFGVKNLEDYLRFSESIGDNDYHLLESQANSFAGHFLVPSIHLETQFKKCSAEIMDYVSTHFRHQKKELYIRTVVDIIASKLSVKFNVHQEPILIRIEREGLNKFFP